MAQLVKLSPIKRGGTEMDGSKSYLFNVNRVTLAKEQTYGSFFNYNEYGRVYIHWELEEALMFYKSKLANYDAGIHLELPVYYYGLGYVNANRVLSVDDIIYVYDYLQDATKCVIFYFDGTSLPVEIIIDMTMDELLEMVDDASTTEHILWYKELGASGEGNFEVPLKYAPEYMFVRLKSGTSWIFRAGFTSGTWDIVSGTPLDSTSYPTASIPCFVVDAVAAITKVYYKIDGTGSADVYMVAIKSNK